MRFQLRTPSQLARLASALLFAALLSQLAAACSRDRARPLPSGVAMVDGKAITAEELELELAFSKRSSPETIPTGEEERRLFRDAVLWELIDRALVLKAAAAAGISITQERVDRELLKLKAQYLGLSLDDALAEAHVTQQELRERTMALLITERFFVEQVYPRVAASDAEIEELYKSEVEGRQRPEELRAAQIVVKTQEEARSIQKQLRAGLSFEDAARRFSLSPDGKLGGDLGYFPRGVMPPVFDEVCFALPVGRVSEIVASHYGFHLFKVLDRRPAKLPQLESMRAQLEEQLVRSKREEAQRATMKRLRESAKVSLDEQALAAVNF